MRMWYWELWYNVWWYNIWRSTLWLSKCRWVWEYGIGIDGITCEDQHLAGIAWMDDITCDDLTYDDLNPDVCENVVLGLMI